MKKTRVDPLNPFRHGIKYLTQQALTEKQHLKTSAEVKRVSDPQDILQPSEKSFLNLGS